MKELTKDEILKENEYEDWLDYVDWVTGEGQEL